MARLIGKGICPTCKNNSNCTLHVRSTKPVMNCEEFQNEAALVPAVGLLIQPKPAKRAPGAKGKRTIHAVGLCPHCESRVNCVLPKPEGGVWHCEEYR